MYRLLLIISLLITLSSCANSANQEALEKTFAPDPKLNPSTNPTPTPTNPTTNPPNPQLPADFPSTIPFYANATLVKISGDRLTTWSTKDPANLVENFYQRTLAEISYSVQAIDNPTDIKLIAKKDNQEITITIPKTASSETLFTIGYQTIISTDNNTTTTSPTPTITPSTQPSATFEDLSNLSLEHQKIIIELNKLGVIPNQNKFEPDKTITRREYATWLFTANNKYYHNNPAKQIKLATPNQKPVFQDVPPTHPDFGIIQGLADAGLIKSPLTGHSTEVLFKPDNPLTRVNLIEWKVPLDTRQALPKANLNTIIETWGFQDAAKIDPKAWGAILADFQNGDIANIRRTFGYTTLFQPQKPVSRLEAAITLSYFGSDGQGITLSEALEKNK